MAPLPNKFMFQDSLADRDTIDADSTAVLAFDDGTRVPCDRYVMRCFSSVIKRLLEDVECEHDDRGRTIVPVPSQPSAPYWTAVDMLHGCKTPFTLSAGDVVAIIGCMEYMGVTAYDNALDVHLWRLVEDAPLTELVVHAPRLLRNTFLAAQVVRRCIKLKPLWF